MSLLANLETLVAKRIWDGVVARVVEGRLLTLAVVELDPDALVPEHRHENEQLGFVIRGSVTFVIGDETEELGPGGTWRIPSDSSHVVRAGPDGAVVVDVFSPPRGDWAALDDEPAREPRWPDGRRG